MCLFVFCLFVCLNKLWRLKLELVADPVTNFGVDAGVRSSGNEVAASCSGQVVPSAFGVLIEINVYLADSAGPVQRLDRTPPGRQSLTA